jgi:hypothetical protein
MCSSGALFINCIGCSAYLREQKNGRSAIWKRSLFLAGACGLPAPIFYATVSRGLALQIPEIDILLLFFGALAACFHPKRKVDSMSSP